MTNLVHRQRTWLGWVLKIALVIGLIVAGQQVGDYLTSRISSQLTPSTEPMIHRMVMVSIVVYIVFMALPFVPAAEIGLGLMMMFGAPIVPLVYTATVTSMTLAFLIGRLVPQDSFIAVMHGLRLRRMAAQFERMRPLLPQERLSLIAQTAPRGMLPMAMRFRYVALAVLINLPGNSVIGGGGGLSMLAGFSRVFPVAPFVLTVALAVLPVPLIFYLGT